MTNSEIETLSLPVFGIVLRRTLNSDGDYVGEIESDLHTEESGGVDVAHFNACVDVMQSLVLAHYCAGVDVSSAAYLEGIETAYEAMCNHLG